MKGRIISSPENLKKTVKTMKGLARSRDGEIRRRKNRTCGTR
jgi:hypothetical protein